jgi:hypothetical protein
VVKIIISMVFYSTPMMASLLASGSEDEDDDEVAKVTNGQEEGRTAAGCGEVQTTGARRGAPSASTGGKVFCDIDNCPGLNFNPAETCCLCEAEVHVECFLGTVRKLNEYPVGCHDQVFCSDVCCTWHGNEKINVEDVRKERTELQNLLKKQLVEKARNAHVKVTHRVDKKSLQVSKAMMVRRLMAKKFSEIAGVGDSVAIPKPKPQKTVHVRFRLINCLFSDELTDASHTADNVDRAALDAGAVGDNSLFWKLCEERFNNGFPADCIDGPTFADTLHFRHPTIDNHHEQVNPALHGVFSSSDLVSLWKEIQKEYERVFMNFKKSGNHNSSFTKEAMKLYKQADGDNDNNSVDSSVCSTDLDDVFGVEEGGFCNFTNSIVIIYLRLWLNEKPGLTGFVSRELPAAIQIDSMNAPSSAFSIKRLSSLSSSDRLRRSPDILADSINNLAKARKIDDGRKEMHSSIAKFHETETLKSSIVTKREEIELVRTQIRVLTERYENCIDLERKEKYRKGLIDLEDKLDLLLMS